MTPQPVEAQTDRYAVLGSEHSHAFDVFICDVGGDDQDGRIGITQLIGAVYLTDGPALIREALTKHMQTRVKIISKVCIKLCKNILYQFAICFICSFFYHDHN